MAKLKTVADEMLHNLRTSPRSRITLGRGLTLSLTKTGSTYSLTCGRRGILPSQQELQIVAGAFNLLNPEWNQIDINEWRCYRYTWQWVEIATLVEDSVN